MRNNYIVKMKLTIHRVVTGYAQNPPSHSFVKDFPNFKKNATSDDVIGYDEVHTRSGFRKWL